MLSLSFPYHLLIVIKASRSNKGHMVTLENYYHGQIRDHAGMKWTSLCTSTDLPVEYQGFC